MVKTAKAQAKRVVTAEWNTLKALAKRQLLSEQIDGGPRSI
jgi:hypothetical protein